MPSPNYDDHLSRQTALTSVQPVSMRTSRFTRTLICASSGTQCLQVGSLFISFSIFFESTPLKFFCFTLSYHLFFLIYCTNTCHAIYFFYHTRLLSTPCFDYLETPHRRFGSRLTWMMPKKFDIDAIVEIKMNDVEFVESVYFF